MNASLTCYSTQKLLPETALLNAVPQYPAGSLESKTEELEYSFEAIRARADVVTEVLKDILNVHPASHWGINE